MAAYAAGMGDVIERSCAALDAPMRRAREQVLGEVHE
jgi:hypothetical protein